MHGRKQEKEGERDTHASMQVHTKEREREK